MHRLALIIALLGAIAFGLPSMPAADATEAAPSIRVHISHSMTERFGGDADGNGFIDMPNTSRYVHASCEEVCPSPRFEVALEATILGVDIGHLVGGDREFRWTITGAALESPLLYSTAYPELAAELPEGEFTATVTTTIDIPWARLVVGRAQTIVVDDILIVAIGDSYAAGEGNPEAARRDGREPRWGDSPDAEAAAAHAEAHRSSLAWPSRLALTMERTDRSTSVTFVSVAESGATISDGLVGARNSRSQVDQVRDLVGDRPVDILLIQVGGNDIGFGHAVQALVEADPLFDPVCYRRLIDNVFASVADGDWSRGVSLGYEAPVSVVCRPAESDRGWGPLPGLEGLPGEFTRLATAVRAIDAGEVVLVGYPDPTGSDAEGTTCAEIVGDTAPPLGFHEIDRNEQRLGVERLLVPLNDALREAARRHGWRYVDGIAQAFAAGHGYCAPWPDYGASGEPGGAGRGLPSLSDPDRWFRNPGRFGGPILTNGAITWYRTAAQSAALQGPGARFLTTGTLHPNEIGHEAIARIVLAALRS